MTEMQTAAEWCEEHDIRVLKPTGWKRTGTKWGDPITLDEFLALIDRSTVSQGPKCELFR